MIRRLMLGLAALALASFTLAACAPMIQTAASPIAGFAGPRLEREAVVSFDGARLGLSTWEAQGEPWAVIVALHGMNDYAGAFRTAAPYWARQGITTYAYDQRGYGRSPNRGQWPGEALMNEDLRTVTALVRARHPNAVLAVVGESMGSAVAISAFASERPPTADRLVLLAPAVWGWSSQPLPQKVSAWVAGRTVPSWQIEPPRFIAEHHQPTDNIALWREISRDPNMLWDTRMDAIYGIVDLMESGWAKTGDIEVPTAYLYGQKDEVIPAKPSFQAAARLKPTDRTAFYPDGYHLLLIDKQAETVWRDVAGFIKDPAAPLASRTAAIPRPGSLQASGKTKQKAGSKTTSTSAAISGAVASGVRH